MNTRIIRNLLLWAVLVFSFVGGNQEVGASDFVRGSFTQQGLRTDLTDQAPAPPHQIQACDLFYLAAPVQEFAVSLRRIEPPRSEESPGGMNAYASVAAVAVYGGRAVAVNDCHNNAALCHNSRYYLNKFGTLLI